MVRAVGRQPVEPLAKRRKRYNEMVAMQTKGASLRKIGARYDLSPERVRQILAAGEPRKNGPPFADGREPLVDPETARLAYERSRVEASIQTWRRRRERIAAGGGSTAAADHRLGELSAELARLGGNA